MQKEKLRLLYARDMTPKKGPQFAKAKKRLLFLPNLELVLEPKR